MGNEITRQKFSSVSKKLLSLLLSLIMLFSVTSAIPITAEAATQNALWFMDDLKITQVPGGDYSHKGTQNFDVVGVKNNNIKAPFDCKIVKIHKGKTYGNTVIIESTNKVLYADGTIDYMSMCFAHDNDISDLSVGKTLKQGQVFYQTGTYGNVTGRHSHVTVIKGKYKNDMWTKNSYNNYCSPNAINPTKGLFITDKTNVVDKKGLTFKKVSSTPTATCTIAYNANGGTGSMGTSTVKYNNKFTLASNSFSRTGYSFGGWNVCRKSDGKWFTTNGNGWQTASNISSKGYTKKVYNDRWSGTLDNSWFSTVKNDTYTFYAIWKKSSSTSTSTGSQVVEYAKKFKGYPYVLNTHGPNSFDCSGFVYYVFKNFGVTLSTASSDYYNNPTKYGTKITGDSNAQLGDIVVWSGHVGIYIGSGKVINALNPSKGVCETKISEYINSSGTMNPSHFYIRVKGIGSSSSGSTTTPTVTNPSVTVNAISDLTTNSVRINFTAKNPSKVTIKTIGVQVRKKGTSDWKTKQEAMNASYTNAASVPMWWTVGSGKELNMSLTSGTTYEYRAYVVYNSKNYYSSISTFTTKGPTPHTHNYNYVTVTIRPTCTEGGYTEYRCSCGDSYIGNYTSAAGHKAVTGKAVDATCTTAGKTAGSHCSVCNTVIITQETVPAAGHSYDTGRITKKPTATATGIKTFTCIDCGATKTETLPATKLKTPTAKTTVNANGGFTISWNKISGADKYDVYIDNGSGYKLLRTVTGTSTTTGTAHYGKKYSYKVRAINSKNSAITSAFSTAVTAVNTKKLVTPKLKATVNANGTFKLSWNKVAGADKYELYIKQADGSYKLMKTTTATSFTTAFATYGKQFSYKMRAVNSKNKSIASAYSSVVNAKNTKKLQTPSLKVAVNKNGSFKLSWGKVAGAEKYELYIKQANGSYKLMKTTTSTSFTTAVASKGKTYSYKVRAVTSKNKNATSSYSKVVSAKRK
ncbi:MAG: C40 family peptidase [Eubacterium sp.]|nr:C40 family peptidase [Eubacterium sp.]